MSDAQPVRVGAFVAKDGGEIYVVLQLRYSLPEMDLDVVEYQLEDGTAVERVHGADDEFLVSSTGVFLRRLS